MPKKQIAPARISHEDWQAAIVEATTQSVDHDPNLITYEDFAKMQGCVIGTARRYMAILLDKKLAVKTTKRVIASDGRLRTVIAFRLVKKNK